MLVDRAPPRTGMTEAGSSSSSSSSSSHGRGGQAQAGPMSAMAAQSQSQSQSKRLKDPRLRAGAGGVAASAPRSDKGKGRSATDCDGDCDSQEQELQLHTCGHEQQQQQQPADLRVTMMQSQITPKSGLPLFDALDVETLRLENDMLRRQAAVLASRNGSLRTASPGDAASLMMRGSLAGTDRLDDPDLRHLVEQSLRRSCTALQKDREHLKIRLRESNGQRARLEQELRYLRSFLLESVRPVSAEVGHRPEQSNASDGAMDRYARHDNNNMAALARHDDAQPADPAASSSDLRTGPASGDIIGDIDMNDESTLPAGSADGDISPEIAMSGDLGSPAPTTQPRANTINRPSLPSTARAHGPSGHTHAISSRPRRVPLMGDAETEFLLTASKRLTLPLRKRMQPLHPSSQIPLLPGALEEAVALSQAALHACSPDDEPLHHDHHQRPALRGYTLPTAGKRELQGLLPKLGSPIQQREADTSSQQQQQRGRAGSRPGRRPSTYKERSLSPLSPRREPGTGHRSSYGEDAAHLGDKAAMAAAIASTAPRTSAGEMALGSLGPAFAQSHAQHAEALREGTPPFHPDPVEASPAPTGTPGSRVPKRIGRPKGSPNKTKTISINETQSTRRRLKAQEFAAQNGGVGRGRGRPSESQSPEQAARSRYAYHELAAPYFGPSPILGMPLGMGSPAYNVQMSMPMQAPATPDLGHGAAFAGGQMDVDMAQSVFGSGGSGNVGDLLLAAQSLDYSRAGSAAASTSMATATRARPVTQKVRSPELPKGKGPAQSADDEEEEEYYYEDEEDEDDQPAAGQVGPHHAPHSGNLQQQHPVQSGVQFRRGHAGPAPARPGLAPAAPQQPGHGHTPLGDRPASATTLFAAPSGSQAAQSGSTATGSFGSAAPPAAPPSPLSIVSSRPNRSNLTARRRQSSSGSGLGRQISALDVLADQAQAAASVGDGQDGPAQPAPPQSGNSSSRAAPGAGAPALNASAFRAPILLPPMPPARAGTYNGEFATGGGSATYPGAPVHWPSTSGSPQLDHRHPGPSRSDGSAAGYPHSQPYPYLQFGQYAQEPTQQQQQGVKRSRSGSRRSSGTPGPPFGQGPVGTSVDAEGDLVAPPRTIAEQLRLGVESSHHLIDQADIASGMTPAAALAKKARSPYTKWTPEEDEVLVRGIAEHGTKWDEVAKGLEMRSYHQCRQRWLRGLKSGDALPSHLTYLKGDIERAVAAHEKVKGAKRGTSVMPETQTSGKRSTGRGRQKKADADDEVEDEYEEE